MQNVKGTMKTKNKSNSDGKRVICDLCDLCDCYLDNNLIQEGIKFYDRNICKSCLIDIDIIKNDTRRNT